MPSPGTRAAAGGNGADVDPWTGATAVPSPGDARREWSGGGGPWTRGLERRWRPLDSWTGAAAMLSTGSRATAGRNGAAADEKLARLDRT